MFLNFWFYKKENNMFFYKIRNSETSVFHSVRRSVRRVSVECPSSVHRVSAECPFQLCRNFNICIYAHIYIGDSQPKCKSTERGPGEISLHYGPHWYITVPPYGPYSHFDHVCFRNADCSAWCRKRGPTPCRYIAHTICSIRYSIQHLAWGC